MKRQILAVSRLYGYLGTVSTKALPHSPFLFRDRGVRKSEPQAAPENDEK